MKVRTSATMYCNIDLFLCLSCSSLDFFGLLLLLYPEPVSSVLFPEALLLLAFGLGSFGFVVVENDLCWKQGTIDRVSNKRREEVIAFESAEGDSVLVAIFTRADAVATVIIPLRASAFIEDIGESCEGPALAREGTHLGITPLLTTLFVLTVADSKDLQAPQAATA